MAYESIQAPKSISFPHPRLSRRAAEPHNSGFNLAHWLADDALANDDLPGERFPVPLMSAEGILVLAQAQEEEFALHIAEGSGLEAAPIYSHAAETAVEDLDQLSFEFITDAHGAVVDGEV